VSYGTIPVYINVRDRLHALGRLVDWLERAGHERIILLDNASEYEPLLEYLNDSPHDVQYLGHNAGSRSLWKLRMVPNEWFVYTDPDIVPIEDCPPNAVEHLQDVLQRHPEHQKAALGLHLDDVPASMRSLDWELRLLYPEAGDAWRGQVEPGVYDSLSDTTFALYRPRSGFPLQALRTGWPYQARHECPSWYGGDLTDEDRFYLNRARSGPLGSSWKENAHA
jgi:hypothetical protein